MNECSRSLLRRSRGNLRVTASEIVFPDWTRPCFRQSSLGIAISLTRSLRLSSLSLTFLPRLFNQHRFGSDSRPPRPQNSQLHLELSLPSSLRPRQMESDIDTSVGELGTPSVSCDSKRPDLEYHPHLYQQSHGKSCLLSKRLPIPSRKPAAISTPVVRTSRMPANKSKNLS